jgi:hypothetical protein
MLLLSVPLIIFMRIAMTNVKIPLQNHQTVTFFMIMIGIVIKNKLVFSSNQMATFWMHDDFTGSACSLPITPTMQAFVTSLPVKCYPALATDKFTSNGIINDNGFFGPKPTITAFGKDIVCTFHRNRNGEEWIYWYEK